MNINRLSISLLLAPFLALTACNDEDGDWPPMKWEKTTYATAKIEGQKYIQVPLQGGTYTFTCKNYDYFWLSNVNITTSGYGFTIEKNINDGYFGAVWDTERGQYMQSDGCSVDIDGKTLNVKFDYSDAQRTYKISVTAGDIFDNFYFEQR